MNRHRVRAAARSLLAAVVVYGALLIIALGLAMANGEGLSCRDAECGTVSNSLNHAYPFSMIAAIALAVMTGIAVTRPASVMLTVVRPMHASNCL